MTEKDLAQCWWCDEWKSIVANVILTNCLQPRDNLLTSGNYFPFFDNWCYIGIILYGLLSGCSTNMRIWKLTIEAMFLDYWPSLRAVFEHITLI